MTMEPEYIAQTFEPMTDNDRRAWFWDQWAEAKAKGCTFGRASINPDSEPIGALVEGWKVEPPDQGEPRWQMTETKSIK